jgi:hypothetical protein
MNNFLLTTKSLIKEYNLNIDRDDAKVVYGLLVKKMDALVFNVISIAAIITLINNSSVIGKEAVELVRAYIADKCSKYVIKGGTSLPSDYFGFPNPSYSENNITNDVLNVDFASGILRNQIGGGGYKAFKLQKKDEEELTNNIKSICKYYNLKISNSVIKTLLNIIIENMECLFNYLKMAKKPLTAAIIKKMININKKFEIFK